MEGQAREEDYSPFSYNLVWPLSRSISTSEMFEWFVYEKGSEKLNLPQTYEISTDIIRKALFEMRAYTQRTPFEEFQIPGNKKFKIYLKKEFEQVTGSVKARGVVYTLLQLSKRQKRNGVVGILMGSFAHSLCYFAKKISEMPNVNEEEEAQRQIPVTVVMPTSVEDGIKDMCDLGATVIRHSIQDLTQAHDTALRIAQDDGLVYIDSNDHPNMIIGQATLGLELLENVPEADAVILPTTVNDCGLTAAMAMVIKEWKSNIKVFVVRTSIPDSVTENIRNRTYLLDELRVPVTQRMWFRYNQHMPYCWIDRFITVEPTLIAEAIVHLRTVDIIDFSGAIGLAGLLSGQLDELKDKKVVVPLFGNVGWVVDQRMNNPNLEPGPANA